MTGTTAITDAMIEAGTTELLAIINGKGGGPRESVEAIYLAMHGARPPMKIIPAEPIVFETGEPMQSATPSTPELEELIERCAKAMHKSRCERMGLAHHHDPNAAPSNGDLAEARAALEAAGISSLQKEIDTLTDHIREQISHVETRIQDGVEMGATVWRIALEDVVRENQAMLSSKGGA